MLVFILCNWKRNKVVKTQHKPFVTIPFNKTRCKVARLFANCVFCLLLIKSSIFERIASKGKITFKTFSKKINEHSNLPWKLLLIAKETLVCLSKQLKIQNKQSTNDMHDLKWNIFKAFIDQVGFKKNYQIFFFN